MSQVRSVSWLQSRLLLQSSPIFLVQAPHSSRAASAAAARRKQGEERHEVTRAFYLPGRRVARAARVGGGLKKKCGCRWHLPGQVAHVVQKRRYARLAAPNTFLV